MTPQKNIRNLALHILASLLVLFLISWCITKWLNNYTLHGTTTEVPNLIGMKVSEVESFLAERELTYEISDSVFDNSFPKGSIVEQNPSGKSLVKHNRKIYLTVNALSTRFMSMPELTDVSYTQAEATLNSYGLKVGHVSHEPGECDGCIIRTMFRGKKVAHKDKIPYGARVDLVIGQTTTGSMIETPDILNLTLDEADLKLQEYILGKVAISYVNCPTMLDSGKATIQYQSPAAGEQIKQGSTISVWLSCQ